MRSFSQIRALTFVAAIFLFSCKKEYFAPAANNSGGQIASQILQAASPLYEGFENGSKISYDSANVQLASGSWLFNDALIGTSASDRKDGSKSVRIEKTGSIRMNFDYTSGVYFISFKYAKYGSDAKSTFEVQISTNGGASYKKLGKTIKVNSNSLLSDTIIINQQENIRLAIVKLTGTSTRINIDDITIGAFSTSTSDNDNMLLGNPTNATADTSNYDNYLMIKTYYDLSYSRTRGTPNWVCWHLQATDLGSVDRSNNFRIDSTLPANWFRVDSAAYVGSGFDRGHNCPSGDRTANVTMNSATFLMTNMIPQAPHNNEYTWANLEDSERAIVDADNEVYIIMGSYGMGGSGTYGNASTVDKGHVTVPSNIWKVILVLPLGNNDLSRIDTTVRVIAVNTPNINTTNDDWKVYRTSVNAIEAACGDSLFTNLPQSVQAVLKKKVDNL